MGKQYEWLKQFVDKCKENGIDEACVDWPFSRKPSGHGQLSANGRCQIAARLVFELYYGHLPLYVAIACGNKGCINPTHMAGCASVSELMKKTRTVRKHIISDDQAKQMVQLIRERKLKHATIAEMFGVSAAYVSNFNYGKVFSHITGASSEKPIARQGTHRRITPKLRVRINELRACGMLQREVGKMLGLDHSTVSRVERGLR